MPMACAPGTYAAGESNTECTSCTIGKYASSSGATSCSPCLAGSYSPNVLSCLICPIGEYCPPGATVGTSCALVLDGGTTKETGASSPDECDCKPGLFKKEGECADGQAEFQAAGVADGIDFTEPGITIATLPLKPHFWRVSNTSLAVGRCYTEGVCAGATPGGAANRTAAGRRLQTTAPALHSRRTPLARRSAAPATAGLTVRSVCPTGTKALTSCATTALRQMATSV